jgi:hypothetical protein
MAQAMNGTKEHIGRARAGQDARAQQRSLWGRQNLAIPLGGAEAASERYGWPPHIIEDCADDPPVEQADAFLTALDRALGGP